MEQQTKEQATSKVFEILPGLKSGDAPVSFSSGRNIKMTAETKFMMDVYNAHYAPMEGGRKKTESINCYPCVKKVFLFFTKLQAGVPTS